MGSAIFAKAAPLWAAWEQSGCAGYKEVLKLLYRDLLVSMTEYNLYRPVALLLTAPTGTTMD